MKLLFLLVTLLFSEYAGKNLLDGIDKETMGTIRVKFYASVESEEELENLSAFIVKKFSDNYKTYPPVIKAFWGGIEALKAKHSFWPFNQLSHVIEALDIFEEAIAEDPRNLEIRVLRFSVLHNIPGIFGVGEDRKKDADLIVEMLLEKNYSEMDFELQRLIIDFMLESERLSPDQENSLRKIPHISSSG